MGNIEFTQVVIFIVVVVLVLLALRELNTWYWKLNEIVKNQEKQLNLIKKQLDVLCLLSLKSGVPDTKITSALDKTDNKKLTTREWIEAKKKTN